jgi:membrane associated rhomboid family serine protease
MVTKSFLNSLKQFDYKLKFKLFIKLTTIILALNLIYILFFAFFSSDIASTLFIYNPLFSPFIHSGLEHLLYNLLFLILVILPDYNSNLGLNNLVKFSLLISFILFPLVLLNITTPMIGISGLCYLLLSRVLLTRKSFPKFNIGFLLFFSFYEFTSLGNSDSISHLCHCLGITIGVVSIVINKQWMSKQHQTSKYIRNLNN